jgi:magnesium transporter
MADEKEIVEETSDEAVNEEATEETKDAENEEIEEVSLPQEIINIIRSEISDEELKERLDDYHENDIAEALENLEVDERKKIYGLLGLEKMSEIFTYIEDADVYAKELDIEQLAEIVSEMDSDDAVDFLEDVDDETKENIISNLDEEAAADIELINSYDEDEIGSKITTNYILIKNNLSIRQAMRELVAQAGENDNISTIYVEDEEGKFYGAIDLKDLIVARDYSPLSDLISTGYPSLNDHEKIDDCIERIKDYAEDSIPVLNENKEIIGIITAQDIIEVVDEEMSEDYAKLAGLTEEGELDESLNDSVRKRLPWLIILLFLGMGVSTVVGLFENVVSVIPIVVAFQSLILGMAGNVGTQSLAVTIRVLMDENLSGKEKVSLAFKEMKVGFMIGISLGVLSLIIIGLYITFLKGYTPGFAFTVSACVAVAVVMAMTISSLVGTLVPMLFEQIHVDPAVASGPLISTVNDLVAVITYYGFAWILLLKVLKLA